jgi:hypothetical protein
LRTPDQLRGLTGGSAAEIAVGVSNFSTGAIDVAPRLSAEGADVAVMEQGRLAAAAGDVGWVKAKLTLPAVTAPRRVELRAEASGLEGNSWTLWCLPKPGLPATLQPNIVRLAGVPFGDNDKELEFEDRGYSSGWGSPVRSWSPLLPDPELLAPELATWRGGGPPPAGTRCILAHKLTPEVVNFLIGGGRIVLMVSRARGSAPVKYVNMWGQLPLILEQGPLGPGDAEWVADLLDHDLSRRSVRAVPAGELGLDEALEPIVRLVYCHDIVDQPKVLDFVSTARVGGGLLVLSAVDHSTPGGRYMLDRLLSFAASDAPGSTGRLDEALVRSWALER